ncbi:phage tail tip lysozyme [Lactiplantibacillus plantarum]|uniref:phage tail tip lysozyme n=1 Tax=Lactiplantibacillus plantarum TaxID=1590 RepID=UPI000E59915A|nr:phage tail tip lysozyme [Lactiplantibacillus plantarum]MCB7465317.1 phage tail-type lysozyme domain-containing protein [Lactiplantibacillus plantarum]MCB7468566.1 phage tail-type lysozyme domain-containing protein [Lactiplantibacillus plantarum]MCB7472718.1 phage tail-type lysozyme domain-containing protein [Lactiplantibacillus plantarum]MCB7475150.1 phage tail-type lysozyme domain-containing protein [Lactiplantibacillus plantarum]MCB7478751.1 phage tail-type lysozyme domain-containing prot
MATEKIQGYEFAINMDDGGMTRTLREIKNEAKLLKSGMQANFAEIRSGEGIMAAYAGKVKDAGRAIEAQRLVIERLKSEQNGLDQTTQKGREAYVKYENQINAAKRSIASLEGQQERAQKSLDLQKSGVLQLKDATEISAKVTDSYVAKLKAEGHEFEANKVKASGLHQSYNELNKQLEAEQSILNKIASASGNSSKEFKEQQIRVNELSTKIAQTRTKMKELDEQLSKKPQSGLTSVISQLNRVNEHADKANHLFGKILGAHLVANGITSAFQSITSHIHEAISAGMEYEKEQQKMTATWLTLTGTVGKSNAMVKTINDLSVQTGQAVDVVNELEQGFYHLHSNKKESDELTKSMLNMSDAVGLDSQQIQAVTQDMVNGLSRGKANAGMLNQISQYFPMFREQLAKYETQVNHGKKVTVADLSEMAKQGKISASDIEKTFNQLGSGKYDKAADNMLHTMVGMERTIKARVPALIGDIEKPILTAQNPIYGAVSKWVSDKRTDKEFSKVGVAAEKGISTITKAFAKAFDVKSAPKAMNDAMDNLAKGVTKASDSIAKNAPEIVNFFKTVKNLGGLGFETLIESLKITNALLKPLLSMVGGHTETIAKFGAAWWIITKSTRAAGKAMGTVSSVMSGIKWATEALSIKKNTEYYDENTAAIKRNAQAKKADSEISTSNVDGLLDDVGSTKGVETAIRESSELSRVEKYGSKAKGLGKLADMGKFSKLAGGVGLLDVLTASTDLIGTTKKTVGSHVGSFVGNLSGAAGGAALGTAILPGAGTLVGGMLGAFGGDKVGKLLGAKIQKGLDDNKPKVHVVQPKTVKINVSTDTKKVETKLSGYSKKLKNALVVKMSADPSSYAKTKAQTDKLFGEMGRSVDSYYKDKESKSKKDLDKLVKNGSMTQKEENKILSQQQKSDKKAAASKKATIVLMQKDTQDYYSRVRTIENGGTSKLEKIAQKYGRNSERYEKEKNRELASAHRAYVKQYAADEYKLNSSVSKSVSKGAAQQKSILSKLVSDRGKLNLRDLKATQENANKKYNAAVKPARKTRDELEDSASETYKSTKKTADHEYYDLHAISKKQHDDIVSKAKHQRDETDDAANDQYKKVTKHATDQHKSVTNEIEHQRKEVTKKQQDQQADSIAAATGQSKEVVRHQMRQANSSMKAADKQGSGTHSIWKNITSFFNNLVKGFGIKPINVGAYPSGYTPVTMGAYASGGIVGTARALVGEGGVEAKIDRDNGKVSFLGMNGAEVVNVKPGDQILNAGDTAKLFNGGLGHTLPGYAKGTIDIASFLKKIKSGATSIFDSVSDKAMDALSKITHPLKTLKSMALKTFDPTKTPGVGSIGHDLGKGLVDRALKGFAKAISDLADNFGGGVGNIKLSGSVASRARELARAFKHGYPASNNGGIAGVLGNWVIESNLTPTAIDPLDHGTGLGQWTFTRETALRNWLRKHGYAWDSAAGQINYALNEPGESSLLKSVLRMTNPTEAAYKFFATWESGGAMNGTGGLRESQASAVYRYIKGFENGGFGNKAGVYKLFEGNLPEAIVPMDLSKRSRAYQIMQQIMAKFGAQDGANVINTGNDQIDSDEAFKQRVIASLDALVTGQGDVKAVVANSDVVNAVKLNTKKTSQYSQMMGY